MRFEAGGQLDVEAGRYERSFQRSERQRLLQVGPQVHPGGQGCRIGRKCKRRIVFRS